MKFKKRIAFFLALMLALLTVGCGSKSMSTSEDSATMESVYGTDYQKTNTAENLRKQPMQESLPEMDGSSGRKRTKTDPNGFSFFTDKRI